VRCRVLRPEETDRWLLRAIAATTDEPAFASVAIEAMRQLQRHDSGATTERPSGASLPAPASPWENLSSTA
jgi:hypothetical protein